jgi:hypothetical protein
MHIHAARHAGFCRRWRCRLRLFGSVGLLGLAVVFGADARAAAAADLTYSLVSYPNSKGYVAYGTITTDGQIGTILGPNLPDNGGHIISWSWIATNGTYTVGGSSAGGEPLSTGPLGLTATADALALQYPPEAFGAGENQNGLAFGDGSADFLDYLAEYYGPGVGSPAGYNDIFQGGSNATGHTFQAVNYLGTQLPATNLLVATAIPEPTALLGLLTALIPLALRKRRCCRRGTVSLSPYRDGARSVGGIDEIRK